MTTFSVIIPVFNKWKLTSACLRSLAEHTLDCSYEIIVVDNGSTDATATELDALGGQLFGKAFRSLRFPVNMNFSPACNAGARLATTDLLFFLNNDTTFTDGWMPPLLKALADDSSLVGVGPLLLYPNGTVQHLGVTISLKPDVWHLYYGFPENHPVVGKTRRFQIITGAALLLHKNIFVSIGGFNEQYKNGYEDVDLCIRIHSDTGKYFSCIPQSIVYHYESQTPGRKDNDAYNLGLLSEFGILNKSRFDRHIFGLNDGFIPVINDCFTISLLMHDDLEKRLRSEMTGGIDEQMSVVRENPYFAQGKDFLAETMAGNGLYKEALSLLIDNFANLNSIDSCLKVITLAKQYNIFDNRVNLLFGVYEKMMVMRKNARILLPQYLRAVRARGDKYLEKMFLNKMREIATAG